MALLNDADKIYLGGLAADAVYAGATKIWPKSGFDPTSLGGLKVWLDASKLGLADGATVSAWPNLGSGPAGTIIPSTPVATLKANATNSLPVVRFGGGGSRFRVTGTGVAKDYTVIYVARMWGPNYGRVVTTDYPNAGNFLVGYWNGQMDVMYAGAFIGPATTVNSQWRLYSADAASASYNPRLFSNGVKIGEYAGGAIDGFGGSFHISGYDATATQETCDCDVAEALLYDHKLIDTDRVKAENYLRTKWGL